MKKKKCNINKQVALIYNVFSQNNGSLIKNNTLRILTGNLHTQKCNANG